MTDQEKEAILKEGKALVKIILEDNDCNYLIVKRGENNTGIVVESGPVNLWKDWTVVNFTSLSDHSITYPTFLKETTMLTYRHRVINIEYLTDGHN